MIKAVKLAGIMNLLCILLCKVMTVESFSISSSSLSLSSSLVGNNRMVMKSRAYSNAAPLVMAFESRSSSTQLSSTKDSDPWGDDDDEDAPTTSKSSSSSSTATAGSASAPVSTSAAVEEETNDYPINAPSPILLASSMVLAIASTGSVFELSGGSPVLGFLPTAGIAVVGIPLCFFLFYAAIKKGISETEEDDKNYQNQRNSNRF